MKTFTLAAAALGLAITAGPVLAAGPDERPTMEVSLAGLDLDTVEGQKMLDKRIDRAARQVCDYDRRRTGTRIRSQESKECYAKAAASARQQVAAITAKRRGG
ncbi:MAG: UrcA family protein [Erythrobacter sp.]|jgi:UrcA family protein|nr:UrcA family protein [Erythrobacter sp.]